LAAIFREYAHELVRNDMGLHFGRKIMPKDLPRAAEGSDILNDVSALRNGKG
jgi:hypothetical protein